MKRTIQIAAILLCLGGINSQFSTLRAQGTAFTYQGRLNDGGNPANGLYDLAFTVFDAGTNGTPQGPVLTNAATVVRNGLFTVTLDFGNQFPGADRWLEIAVSTNGADSFATLQPRQMLTPAPYALTAGSIIPGGLPAGTYTNAIVFNNAGNQFAGNGAGITNLPLASLAAAAPPGAAASVPALVATERVLASVIEAVIGAGAVTASGTVIDGERIAAGV